MCSVYYLLGLLFFFFFKQKTAYEMRISDWSSDVCSSDLHTMCKLRIPRHRVGTTDSGEKSLPVHVIVNQHAEITVTGPVRPPTHGQQAAKTSGNYRRE